MPAKPKAPKRRIRANAWGNIKAYLGTRQVHDFGCDLTDAQEWLATGEWLDVDSDVTHNFGGSVYYRIELVNGVPVMLKRRIEKP